MALAYTANMTRPEGFPAHLDVRALVTRNDRKELTAADLEAAVQAFPQTDAETRAHIGHAIDRAKRRETAKAAKTSPSTARSSKSAKRPSSKTSKTSTRKAAKRPTRARSK